MSEEKTQTVVFDDLNHVMRGVSELQMAAEDAISKYRAMVEQITNHKPSDPVTPIDVVKIVKRVFFDHGVGNG